MTTPLQRIAAFGAALLGALAAAGPGVAGDPRPGPVPPALRAELALDPFYRKHVDAGGLPVVGSAQVSDNALAEAAWIVRHMLAGRDDLVRAMAGQKVRAVVMAATEYTTDVPEHARLRPKLYWDRRARGLGATPSAPAVSAGEENLLNYDRDPYPNENIFVHEFAHAIHGTGLNRVDPTFDGRLKACYEAAVQRGLWKNCYAATNRSEYWAEGVQCWFDDNAPPDALHNDIRTRARLKEYDAGLAELCRGVFGDGAWRYVKPRDRKPEERAHLVGYEPNALPRFRWRDAPPGERPTATVETAVGNFDIELDGSSAAAANFLRVALDGGYHSGRFDRATNGAGGGFVVAAPSPKWLERGAKGIPLDPLPAATDLADGSVALIPDGAGSLRFAVFVGDQKGVGAGGAVRIGRVTRGADVPRKLLAALSEAGRPAPPIDIRRVIRRD